MYARLHGWLERKAQAHAAYLDTVQRGGVARYSLRSAYIAGLLVMALLSLDGSLEGCCNRSALEVPAFAIASSLLFAVLWFGLIYASLRFELWLHNRRAP